MSNLKDTDIDDLFRRASDKYPLRTDSASWDRMAAALENKGPEPPDGPKAPEEKRKRRFFWLFLLLPLAGAGYYAWHHAGNSVASHSATGQNATPATDPNTTSATSQNTTLEQPATGATTSASTPTIAAGQTAATPDHTNPGTPAVRSVAPATAPVATAPTGTARTAAAPATTPVATIPGDPRTQNSGPRFLAGHSRQHPGSKNSISQNSISQNSISQNSTNQNNPSRNSAYQNSTSATEDGSTANGANALDDANNANSAHDANNAIRTNNANSANRFTLNSPETGDRLFYDLQRAPISRDYRLSVNVTAPPATKDSAAKLKDAVKPKDKTKHFYAGIFGSPDLSTVKMQSVQGVGTTFGVILGYTFKGGHWAIETGAYVDRKKYYTEGEYFSTKEITLPANSWLTEVNGTCYMWEIPLNARYNFNPGAKTSWFATAGLSTYLMTSENYSYGLEWPGSTKPYDSDKNFKKPSQYPFSIINLSAGFEQRLGKIGNLRVEPYVRLPLTGLGMGKLPIMSAGVNIGITRQLW